MADDSMKKRIGEALFYAEYAEDYQMTDSERLNYEAVAAGLPAQLAARNLRIVEAAPEPAQSAWRACNSAPFDSSLEASCTQPFNIDDGVPYCDVCGMYRSSKHKLRGR